MTYLYAYPLLLSLKVMSGNGFLIRCKEMIVDRNLLSSESDYKKVGFGTAAKYTAVQVRRPRSFAPACAKKDST